MSDPVVNPEAPTPPVPFVCDKCSRQATRLLVQIDSSGRLLVVKKFCRLHNDGIHHPLLSIFGDAVEVEGPI